MTSPTLYDQTLSHLTSSLVPFTSPASHSSAWDALSWTYSFSYHGDSAINGLVEGQRSDDGSGSGSEEEDPSLGRASTSKLRSVEKSAQHGAPSPTESFVSFSGSPPTTPTQLAPPSALVPTSDGPVVPSATDPPANDGRLLPAESGDSDVQHAVDEGKADSICFASPVPSEMSQASRGSPAETSSSFGSPVHAAQQELQPTQSEEYQTSPAAPSSVSEPWIIPDDPEFDEALRLWASMESQALPEELYQQPAPEADILAITDLLRTTPLLDVLPSPPPQGTMTAADFDQVFAQLDDPFESLPEARSPPTPPMSMEEVFWYPWLQPGQPPSNESPVPSTALQTALPGDDLVDQRLFEGLMSPAPSSGLEWSQGPWSPDFLALASPMPFVPASPFNMPSPDIPASSMVTEQSPARFDQGYRMAPAASHTSSRPASSTPMQSSSPSRFSSSSPLTSHLSSPSPNRSPSPLRNTHAPFKPTRGTRKAGNLRRLGRKLLTYQSRGRELTLDTNEVVYFLCGIPEKKGDNHRVCAYVFTDRNSLDRHVTSCHAMREWGDLVQGRGPPVKDDELVFGGVEARGVQCGICTGMFARSDAAKRHRKKHTAEERKMAKLGMLAMGEKRYLTPAEAKYFTLLPEHVRVDRMVPEKEGNVLRPYTIVARVTGRNKQNTVLEITRVVDWALNRWKRATTDRGTRESFFLVVDGEEGGVPFFTPRQKAMEMERRQAGRPVRQYEWEKAEGRPEPAFQSVWAGQKRTRDEAEDGREDDMEEEGEGEEDDRLRFLGRVKRARFA